jgi:DNA-binding transcriptional LysR family regulator
MAFCRAAAEAGAGIALLPLHTAIGSAAAGRIERVLPAWRDAGAALFVVLPSARHVPARVALVRDFLVARLERQLAESEARCREAQQAAGEPR